MFFELFAAAAASATVDPSLLVASEWGSTALLVILDCGTRQTGSFASFASAPFPPFPPFPLVPVFPVFPVPVFPVFPPFALSVPAALPISACSHWCGGAERGGTEHHLQLTDRRFGAFVKSPDDQRRGIDHR